MTSILQTKSGKALFPIGIGTWDIASAINPANPDIGYEGVGPVYGNEDTEIAAIRYSLSQGQNVLDCAELYGGFYTDEVVGRALKDLSAISGLQREDVFIGDKIWKGNVADGRVRPAVEMMLRKLGTDYLDMASIHAPWPDTAWQEAIPQIDDLIDAGLVRAFGVSNFTVAQMEEAQALSKYKLVANQVNFNVVYQDEADAGFRAYCHDNNIQIVAYQPIKQGEVLQDTTVQQIAQAHGATAAQIALAWLIQLGALPIPKAISHEHIDENIAAAAIVLSDQEMARLTKSCD